MIKPISFIGRSQRIFRSPKSKTAFYLLIIYRMSKIWILFSIFKETPIIWIPTTLTTAAILYWNLTRTTKKSNSDNSLAYLESNKVQSNYNNHKND